MAEDPDFIEKHKEDLAASLEFTIVDILMKKLNNKENQLRYPMEVENNYNPNRRSWTNC